MKWPLSSIKATTSMNLLQFCQNTSIDTMSFLDTHAKNYIDFTQTTKKLLHMF